MTTQGTVARDRLREIVAIILELAAAEVNYDDQWAELGMDSLEKVETITHIEEEFGLSFSAEEASRIGSVADAVAVLDSRGTSGRTEPQGHDLVARLVGGHVTAGRGGRTAYIDPDLGTISYAALHEAARGYAGTLRDMGVSTGARGVVVAEDSTATVVAVIGHWWNGSVPVLVSPLLAEHDIALIVRDCAACVVHVDGGDTQRMTLLDELAAYRLIDGERIRQDIADAAEPRVLRPCAAATRPHVWSAAGEALVQYTSGSTGKPKGVRHSTAGLLAMIDSFGGAFGLRHDDVLLTTARLSFGYGFGNAVLCVLAAGAGAALIRGAVDPYVVEAALRRHRPTVLCSVPRLYAALLATAAPTPDTYDSLRLCTSAGEHCPEALAGRISSAFGMGLTNCFGATEIMHVALVAPPDRLTDGTLGFPVPGVRVTVRDDRGAEVSDGRDGRLHVSGPTVALGYVDCAEADQSAFADGGVYTGDLVRREVDGSLSYLCRADDVLNIGGYKVVPTERENVVCAVAGVAACAVIAGRDANGLEQAVACIQAIDRADAQEVRRRVVGAVRRELPAHKRPSRVELFDRLPRTTSGKISVHQLREQVAHA